MNDLWKKYDDNMSLYKFYFDLSIKVIIWSSGVIGAIFTFYIANPTLEYVTNILIIPIFLSLFLTALSIFSAILMKSIGDKFFLLCKQLEMDTYPAITPLKCILVASSLFFFFTAIGLSIIIYNA